MLKKLFRNRKGTAEVIGTIMFIVILMFFFTNVYLWHDAATKDMNELYVKKMNAGMSISFDSSNNQVIVKATASDVKLSRLWIDTSSIHVYANLPLNLYVAPGDTNALTFTFNNPAPPNSDGSVIVDSPNGNTINVRCAYDQSVRFTIVNTLGITVST